MSTKKRPAGFKKIYLEPDNQLFSEVMSNGKKYIIPRFQRDYFWEFGHWEELWQDIEEMRESRTQHFMGYLVFQTGDGKTFQIIDGQQRLTTLSIIVLAALGKLKKLIGEGVEPKENAARIEIYQNTYVGISDPVTLTTEPKLILNRHNNSHFRAITNQFEITAQRNIVLTNRKINQAFRFFKDKFLHCASGEAVAKILADIADGLLFTTITVQDDLNAYTVFETLNARGLHLSTPDLLKNYLLSTMASEKNYSEQHFRYFEEQWGYILDQLGETEFTGFLRSYRGIHNKLVNKRDLFHALKQDVKSPTDVLFYLEDLKKYAPVYAALQNPHDNFWNENDGLYSGARTHLEILKLFNIKTPLSLLMAGFSELPDKDFISLLKHVVAVTIRYNIICGKPPPDQERIYNQMANTLANNAGTPLPHLIGMLKPVYPDDAEFLTAFSSKSMPSRQSSKKIVFLLRKIEQQISSEEPPLTLTLEHVLPFSPDDAWQDYFGRSTYEDAIGRLGNMALLPARQNKGQERFAEKRAVLRGSTYAINRHIAEYPEWNMDNLQDHQKWLAKKAKTIWRISQLEKSG